MSENIGSDEELFDEATKVQAFDRIAEKFFNKNFGTMQKSEFELLLFSVYIDRLKEKSKAGDKENKTVSLDDYSISKQLGITPRQVNNLKIKKQLKYPDQNASLKDEMPAIIEDAAYENGRIKLYIENPVVRMELEHALSVQGSFADYSFNPHILSISPLGFLDLIPLISEDEAETKKRIVKNLNGKINAENKVTEELEKEPIAKTFKEAGIEMIKEVIKDAIPGGKILSTALEQLSKLLANGKNSSQKD